MAVETHYLDTALKAAKKAAKLISANSEDKSISHKDPHNIVTATDLAAEETILKTIVEAYPDHNLFAEETGFVDKNSEYTWIIDPIDGTTNFTRGIAFFCTSVALWHKQEPIVSVLIDPIRNEIFSASANGPAKLNNKEISIIKNNDSVTVVGMGRTNQPAIKERFNEAYRAIGDNIRAPRMLGSTALSICYVACGRLDAFVGFDVLQYDGAAAILVAERAGGYATDFSNNPWRPKVQKAQDLITGSQDICTKIIQIITN